MSGNVSGLEIETDRRFQERVWIFERAGWIAMLLIVVAALAGLTGTSGPASSASVEAGGAKIDYPRIARWQTADSMTVEFSGAGTGRVLLPSAFLEAMSVENVTPQPTRVVATPQGAIFEFELGGGAGDKRVDFALRPDSPSFPQRVAGDVEGDPFEISFMVLP